MQLACENCGAEFEPGRVSRKHRFAVCSYCDTLHNITLITAKRAGREYVPPPLFLPDGLTVENIPEGVRMCFRERNPKVPIGAVVGFMFVGLFVFTGLWAWILAPHYVSGRPAWRVVNVLTVPVILYGIYLTIAMLVNRVEVLVTNSEIVSRKRPLPGLARSRIKLAGVKAVHARSGRNSTENKREAYSLQLVSGNGVEFNIGADYDEPEIADAIKHFVMQAVGLEVRPATVESPRGQTRVLHAQVRETTAPAKIELSCNSCGAPIPLREIRKELLAARCAQCGVVQDARAFLRHGIVRPRRNPGFNDPWVVDVGPGHLVAGTVVRWRDYSRLLAWFVPSAAATLALVPLSLLGFWFLFGLLVPTAIFAVGFGYALWEGLQTRRLAVNANGILIQRGPLRALRSTTLPARDAAQIVSLSPMDAKDETGYGLLLITPDHKRVPLLEGLHDWDHVLYLEQEIERLLSIRDTAVPAARRPMQ